eukprot:m.565100 g.565100  ORF g.565100 m.565100 type:complete len:818 (+) comp22240_c0_seq1:34-2487(+)
MGYSLPRFRLPLSVALIGSVVGSFPWLDDAPKGMLVGGAPNGTIWTNVTDLGILGLGWPEDVFEAPFQRLPHTAQAKLCSSKKCASPCPSKNCEENRCAVWGLSQTPTGLQVRFSTSATEIYFKFGFSRLQGGDWLWALNGHTGIDVYVQSAESNGNWRYATSSGNNQGGGSMRNGFSTKKFQASLGPMAKTSPPTLRNVTLYLPCRGQLEYAAVGVAAGETITALPRPSQRPVVVYGTSILHGAAVSRAGMVYSSQLERMLHYPVVNLGFSGHGLMQAEVGDILGEIDAAVFILDCEYNMVSIADSADSDSSVECLTYDFIKSLRARQPHAAVLLIEGHDATRGWMDPAVQRAQNLTRNGYRKAFNRLVAEHVDGVYFLNGSGKLGGPLATDFEAQTSAVGGVHVTDYAFTHFAEWIQRPVAAILSGHPPTVHPVSVLPVLPVPPATAPPRTPHAAPLRWVEAQTLGMEGQAWPGESPPYGRLPMRAIAELDAAGVDADVKYIANLSTMPSGLLCRFQTNASAFTVQVQRDFARIPGSTEQDDIMSFNGRFGIDLYARDTATQSWRWFTTSASGAQSSNESLAVDFLPPNPTGALRQFTIIFPTHIPVTGVQVGVPAAAQLEALRPHAGQPPLLVWGSSIAQGGVVQNPGVTWPRHLGRLLDREVFNFGFSGACRMQPLVAKYLLELKPSVFIVDCLPNMDAATVTSRAPALFQMLRKGLGPNVPIVVLEGHNYTNAWVLPDVRDGQVAKRAAQKAAFVAARASDPNIHYVDGDAKLASLGAEHQYDAAAGVGVHPTNIAHIHIAEFVAAAVRRVI